MSLRPEQSGLIFAISGFLCWGLVPIYYQSLEGVNAVEILAHRIIWAFLILLVCLAPRLLRGAWRELRRQPKTLGVFVLTSALICGNWLLFTWAATHGQVMATSLGYFINPLLNILLGVVILGERLRRAQVIAVGLAAIGVLVMVVWYGQFPWISLTLAFSFGCYGLLRKKVPADAFVSVLMEAGIAFPLSLGYLIWLWSNGESTFGRGDFGMDAYLFLAGPITIIPLAFFVAGVKRINLSTVGFVQYITPTMSFLLAVFAFGEPFTAARLTTFLFIWVALAIFTIDSIHTQRARGRVIAPTPAPQEG
jgi:chloramphenicol-sensitive protein RarD